MLPVEGVVGSAILTFLVLDASRRISGWGFVAIILAIVFIPYVARPVRLQVLSLNHTDFVIAARAQRDEARNCAQQIARL